MEVNKMKKRFLVAISLILVFATVICGCSKENSTKTLSSAASNKTSSIFSSEIAQTNDTNVGTVDLMKGIIATDVNNITVDKDFINSQANFAVKLFKQTVNNDKNKNVLISPLSAELILAMVCNGADGETKKEFEKLMGGIKVEQLNGYLYNYINNLNDEKIKLNIANSIWIKNGFDINENFLKVNKGYYNANIYSTDFDSATIDDMNEWASDNTEGAIKKLINPDDINNQTVMCLINALLFDADWQYQYEHSDATQEFTNINGKKKTVQTLKDLAEFYYDDGKATGFKNEYVGKNFSFIAMLPNKDVNINDYINGLTGEQLLKTLSNPERVFPNTQMPEFGYEYDCNMSDILSDLGMSTAFKPGKADFNKISPNLNIDKITQKANIIVGEQGTKAVAASTAFTTMSTDSEKEKNVIIDRPFVYMIVDNKTCLPIFMGTVMDV